MFFLPALFSRTPAHALRPHTSSENQSVGKPLGFFRLGLRQDVPQGRHVVHQSSAVHRGRLSHGAATSLRGGSHLQPIAARACGACAKILSDMSRQHPRCRRKEESRTQEQAIRSKHGHDGGRNTRKMEGLMVVDPLHERGRTRGLSP